MQLSRAVDRVWYRFLGQKGQDGRRWSYFDREKFARSVVSQFTSRGAPSVNRVGSRIRSSTAPKHPDPRPRFGYGVDSHHMLVRKPRAGAAREGRFSNTDRPRLAPAPWKTHSTAKLRSAMETFKDYYRTLSVRPTADGVTIKAAFRRLALKYHPDVARNQRAARQFLSVREAYAVLADPEKRREYDRVYRDRTPGYLALSARPKRRERDDQAEGRFRRLGIALDVLGLRVGLAVDAGSVGPKGRRRKRSSR